MTVLLKKHFTTLLLIITCCCFVTSGNAQSDAIIVGKVDSPLSRVIRFEYKRNHFSLEEGVFEAILDTNNVFAVRVKLDEPRAIFCNYRENAVKLYVAPGDTLKMRFSGEDLINTISFDGNAAAHNAYLVKNQITFSDWLNEIPLEIARKEKGSRAYLAYIDSIFLEKRSFYDSYPFTQKATFTNDFLEFATNDINYWRAYELMLYVKTYGLNNTDSIRVIDNSYFNFTLETDNIYYKALNNEYYLQYLDLYLTYLGHKNGLANNAALNVVEEKNVFVKVVKPKNQNLRVLEEPYLSRDVVSWLAPNEEAIYQNLLTNEKFLYVGEDATFEDIFLKIKTNSGKLGWIPQSAVNVYEKTIVERTVHNRLCFYPDEPLCGFDKYLSGKVLFFAVAKDIIYSCVYDNLELVDVRVKKYIGQNLDHNNYNDLLRKTQDLAFEDRTKGIHRLNIPPSCDIEAYWRDRIYYARNLGKLRPQNANMDLPDVVIDYITPLKVKKDVEKRVENTPIPAVMTETKPVETIIENTTPPVVNTDTKSIQPKVEATNTEVENTTPPIVNTDTKPVETIIEITTPPVVNVETKSVETKVEITTPPVVNTETKPVQPKVEPTNTEGVKFTPGDDKRKMEFNTAAGYIPLEDYDPTGKPLIFKGMVINEYITPFEFTDIDKNPIRQQDFVGKIIVLNFWATWCSPCKPTMEYTQRLANKYSDKDVVFMYVSADSDAPTWKEYLKEHPMKGIQGLDDNRLLRINLRIQGVPNYFIVDKTGRVAYNSIIQSKFSAEEMIDILLKSP